MPPRTPSTGPTRLAALRRCWITGGGGGSSGSGAATNLASGYSKLPIAFEQNIGQTDAHAQYLARIPGGQVFLTGNAALFSFGRPTAPTGPQLRDALQMQFTGANANAPLTPSQELTSRANYFTQAGW